MTGQADRWIRRTTIGCVGLLALIAATVSYLHMPNTPGAIACRMRAAALKASS